MNDDERKVLLIDDDAMVRGWVRLALSDAEFRVVGEAVHADEALDLIERRRPELLLIDYRLPGQTGTELIRSLRRAGITTPAILMTANTETGLNETVREAGGQGTTLKTGSSEELLRALRTVAAGRTAFDVRHPTRAAGRGTLSPREREALALVAKGATNGAIAAQLGVGEETVKTLLARSFGKLGARKRAEAVSRAHELGLL
jgi:DNA-binding NarL/FixJ family response regulator